MSSYAFRESKTVADSGLQVIATGTVKKLSQDLYSGPQHMANMTEVQPAITYVDTLMWDIGLTVNEMQTAMEDRDVWKAMCSHQLQTT